MIPMIMVPPIPDDDTYSESVQLANMLDAKIEQYKGYVDQNRHILEQIKAENRHALEISEDAQKMFNQVWTVLVDVRDYMEQLKSLPYEVRAVLGLASRLTGTSDAFLAAATRPQSIDIDIANTLTASQIVDVALEQDLLNQIERNGAENIEELDKMLVPNELLDVVKSLVKDVVPFSETAFSVGQLLATYYRIRRGKKS